MNKYELEKMRFKKISHEIGLKLLKFARNKSKICIYAEADKFDDLFPCLMYFYQCQQIGNKNIDFFDNREIKLEDLNGYDMIIILTGDLGKRDIKYKILDFNHIQITFYSDKFDNESFNLLAVSFEDDLYDIDINLNIRKIKSKYEYLIK